MNLSIFDYGAGNLHSLLKTLTRPGVTVRVDTDPKLAVTADALCCLALVHLQPPQLPSAPMVALS